ncbi:protein-disulfide reductase DsbD family protein [Parabacteroides goldsteinii]|uniref:Thiol:disulfide interchange protein n=2 Tax=Parabacteroides goldsteinii TaxID=328812 RepID=A0A6G1ZK55_9BACT|nr:cytochrome c biogenesis protein CcdA [Parabacteroides goldsteinii]MRX95171.1 thiol:disulfide interchange protein [Parabacteroides goldsteinii]MRY00280.1 thiol:disulfide interchange protein [Parabacteroides goldsteinii]MRY05480.1 thiol:disulfide interchange protein [Parabacteroides goldsteinii]MRY14344.1 thiol:disulfide interchange protein [Parabacteroides goldsteinii]MRY23945.1 thiol:disulfide interchange protein [Parabacteroides goldsteinii]
MKKLFSILLLVFVTLAVQAQIHQPVKWKIKLEDSKTAEKEIVFTATIEKGWHLYDMNLPEGGPVSTSFTFETLQGAELIGQPVSNIKPTVVYDEQFAMDLRWFPGAVTFTQKVKILDPKKFKIEGEVEFMVCNDETCLPPDRESFAFDSKNTKLTLPAEAPAVEKEDVTKEQPDTNLVVEEGKTLTTPDPVVKEEKVIVNPEKITNALTNDAALWTPVIDELKAFGDTTVTATDTSWLFIFFAGFLGGLIALLTPCVWPMIPMTVSFFLKRTKDRKKAIRDALTYGLSIIVIYLVMGLLITGIFGASALNDLSTNAIFNIIFFLLLVVFAISFFGAFEMVLPASWTTKLDSKADSTTGILSIFFMSFTLVLVSFSCTGPIIGTLLVQAASMGTAVGPAIGMFGFALALSIPFSLFAIFPNMLQSMPKSGGWLNSVKVVLGFLELALALKFLSVADLAYGWRLLDREVFIVLWIVIFVLLGFYLLGKIKFSHDSDVKYVSVPRLFMAIISFGFAVYMVPGLWGAPLKSISAFAPPLYTQDFSLYDDEVHAAYDDYESGMAKAKLLNKPVMIDFSGFGCVNCRKMEASVWTDPKVKQILENDYVLITLMVDDKTKLPHPIEIEEHGKVRKLKTIGDKWSYLQRSKFGANAQPFYILLNDEGKPLGPSYAFNEDVSKYIQFLENGLKTFKEQNK